MNTIKTWQGLFCPNCEEHGVRIIPNLRTFGMKSYKATCQHCGYGMDNLGSDGTQRKAVDEWESVCEHAAAVKKQLLGATKMKEPEQLELDVGAFMGINGATAARTPWFDGTWDQPAYTGWYEARYKMSDAERAQREQPLQRRYWSKTRGAFSRPVNVGEEYSEDDLYGITHIQATPPASSLEWRGLTPGQTAEELQSVG